MSSGWFYDQVSRCPGLGYTFQESCCGSQTFASAPLISSPTNLKQFVTCPGLDYSTRVADEEQPVPLVLALLSEEPDQTRHQALCFYTQQKQADSKFGFVLKK